MRTEPSVSSSVLLLILGLFTLLLQAPQALAQSGKFTATGKVGPVLAETKMLPGDKPGHEVTMVRRMDTLTYSDPLFASGQATVVAVTDYVGGNGPHRGYFAISHPNGDKTFTSYEGATTATPQPSGTPKVTFEGKWQLTGGTGKFEGITGGGTYKGGLTSAGPAYELEGQYTLKQ
jgi:hypothetical protein